ncbi:hypothetical protein, partial [Rhizobium leguminosarum]|uniref:hypothetical protein n=1 Tax=Rhizobium leguminosarum TaxID=384 RepID=UPI003F943CA7
MGNAGGYIVAATSLDEICRLWREELALNVTLFAVIGMHQAGGFAENHRLVGTRQAEHVVHRARPEEFEVLEIEV